MEVPSNIRLGLIILNCLKYAKIKAEEIKGKELIFRGFGLEFPHPQRCSGGLDQTVINDGARTIHDPQRQSPYERMGCNLRSTSG